jgi:hypothetical protein
MQNTTKKEVFHVAGDAPDPIGTGARGVALEHRLDRTALGHPMLHYQFGNGQELILEADVYALPNQPMYVHLLCPLCAIEGRSNALRIDQARKSLSYDPRESPPPFPGWTSADMARNFPHGSGGLLSVEPFACTWEAQPDLRRAFGLARCPWRVSIVNNVVRNV